MSQYFSSKDYNALPQAESIFLASPEVLAERSRLLARSRRITGFWVTTTVLFAALSAWLGAELRHVTKHGSMARGFRTELGPAKHLAKVEETWFTGSPHFLDDGTEYVPEPANGVKLPKFTGDPSKEIDHNWNLLHFGRFFLLSEDEAREAWGPGYKEFWSPKQGGYVAALEVMHTVHCLDHIRQAFYPEQYPPDSPVHGILHRDHCINHLRQMIICQADLTPIPSRFYIGIDENYIDSDRPHTCRNWAKIREWVTERFNGSTAVPPAPGTATGYKWQKLNGEIE